MDWQSLDSAIATLQASIPRVDAIQVFFTRHDWRPIWSQCALIQDGFRSVRYPSVADRQAAWERFAQVRREASRLKVLEDDLVRDRSDGRRSEILRLCERARWSRLLDTVFFFDRTTVDEMKQLSGLLSQARGILSGHKADMLGAHKQECFEAIKEAQATHDEFWERYKAELGRRQSEYHERQAERARRQVEWDARQQNRNDRIRENIDSNREKLSRAISALYRQRERASEIEERLRETASAKWQDIYGQWLAEAYAKISDIEQSIDRIRRWIEEGEQQLR